MINSVPGTPDFKTDILGQLLLKLIVWLEFHVNTNIHNMTEFKKTVHDHGETITRFISFLKCMLQIDDLLLLKLSSQKKPQRFYKENGSKMKYRLQKKSVLARQFSSTFSCGSTKKEVLNLQNGSRWFKELNRFFIKYKWFGITFSELVWFCISFVIFWGVLCYTLEARFEGSPRRWWT